MELENKQQQKVVGSLICIGPTHMATQLKMIISQSDMIQETGTMLMTFGYEVHSSVRIIAPLFAKKRDKKKLNQNDSPITDIW